MTYGFTNGVHHVLRCMCVGAYVSQDPGMLIIDMRLHAGERGETELADGLNSMHVCRDQQQYYIV